ncbi:MAG: DUF4340 domain-containing protein [Fuerstiella sp.]|nr:DUF4340 domain-containing protein [Fuerstiella sp.]
MSTGTPHSASAATTNPGGRTLLFVVAAVGCLAITTGFEYAGRPAPIEEFGRVGQTFYPDFEDPTLASALEVFAFDAEEVLPQEFIVERLENGRWSIPSHHNYPADAEDQLAKTASSIIGIKRGAMVTRWPADHARYGVIDPNQESLNVSEVDGVGKRLILKAEDDAVLVDYIIGNTPDSDKSDEYYVRKPDEDEVYIVSLSIDLSTKFADWIDTDLLHISQQEMRQITINDYSFNELQGTITRGETSVLNRENSSDPWVLDGLEDTEEVDKDAVGDVTNAVADMKIVGVRKKLPGLTPDLKLDRSALKSQNDLSRLQNDLLSKGFLLQQDSEPDSLKLVAREGELYSATDDGLLYRMYFGRAFTGSLQELEVELNSGEESDRNAEKEDASDVDGNDDEAEVEDDNQSQTGRYVFVRVDFAEENLGDRPVEPVAPQMPEELKQAEEDKSEEEQSAEDLNATEDAVSDEDAGSDDSAEENEEEDPLAELRETYESARTQYETDLRSYNTDLEDFEKKVTDGTEKAEKLNRRFADWYYVVPGETFDKLKLSRTDIVKAKEAEKDTDESATDSADTVPPQVLVDPVEESSSDATEEVSDEESATEEPADENSTSEATPVNDSAEEQAADDEAGVKNATETSAGDAVDPAQTE